MATLSLHLPKGHSDAAAPAKAGERGFFRRVFEALVAARMRQAEREVGLHVDIVPRDPVREAGYRVGLRDMGALPFVR